MEKEIKLPELGENIESAVVGSLLISPGDAVRRDQPVIEVETDKAIAEVPSPYDGVVKEIHVKQGDEIKVGRVLVTLETAQDSGNEKASKAKPSPPAPASETAPSRAANRDEPYTDQGLKAREGEGRAPREASAPALPIPASPAVRRMARELGVVLSEVRGSGPAGRISAEDVKAHARGRLEGSKAPAASEGLESPAAAELPDFNQWGPVRREPMTGLRRRTAEHLARSWSLVPQVTQFDQADITEMENLRNRWAKMAEKAGGKLTITAVLLKVAASALKVHPRFNASLDLTRKEIIYKDYIHIGVAVDAGHGLLVPVIRNAEQKNILQLTAELTRISEKARSKSLTLDEMRGASFTVSNLGGLGTTYFSPLVNWPEAAILGIGRATNQPVYREGTFVPRLILPLSISYDHRLIDGADAARFLRWIAEALEQPLKLALEG